MKSCGWLNTPDIPDMAIRVCASIMLRMTYPPVARANGFQISCCTNSAAIVPALCLPAVLRVKNGLPANARTRRKSGRYSTSSASSVKEPGPLITILSWMSIGMSSNTSSGKRVLRICNAPPSSAFPYSSIWKVRVFALFAAPITS